MARMCKSVCKKRLCRSYSSETAASSFVQICGQHKFESYVGVCTWRWDRLDAKRSLFYEHEGCIPLAFGPYGICYLLGVPGVGDPGNRPDQIIGSRLNSRGNSR